MPETEVADYKEVSHDFYTFLYEGVDAANQSEPLDVDFDDHYIDIAAFFPNYEVKNGFGTKCFDHPNIPFRKLERTIRRELGFSLGAATPFNGFAGGAQTPAHAAGAEAAPPPPATAAAAEPLSAEPMVLDPEREAIRQRLNKQLDEWDEQLEQVRGLGAWKEFFTTIDDKEVIQEIFVEARDTRPIHREGPRQRYQRFREKSFICDVCDHWFTLKQNVQMHIFNYHMGPNKITPKRGKRYKCTKCDQVFKSLGQAQKHERRAHREKVRQMFFKCEQCPKVYQTASQLREHVSIMHLNERPFKCEQCDAAFGRRGGLRRHIVMVHTDHLFMCPIEGCEHPGYKCSKALAAHIRSVHTKDRPFVCLMCEKSFVRKNDLKMHEFTHGNSSSFTCPNCNQIFKRAVYLKKHQINCHQKSDKPEATSRKRKSTEESSAPDANKNNDNSEAGPSKRPKKAKKPEESS